MHSLQDCFIMIVLFSSEYVHLFTEKNIFRKVLFFMLQDLVGQKEN